jgi:tetratricopeptide (TPR) repeat protein
MLAIVFANLDKNGKEISILGLKKLLYLPPIIMLIISLVLLLSEFQYDSALYSLYNNNSISLAEAQVEKAISLNSSDPRFYFLLADIKERKQEVGAAKKIYRYINQNQTSPYAEAFYRLGGLEFKEENYSEAEMYFLQAIHQEPFYDPKIYNSLSQTYIKNGKQDEAISTLEVAIEKAFPLNDEYYGFAYLYDYTDLKAQLAESYLQLITLKLSKNETEDAQRLLTVVDKFAPENPKIPDLKKLMVH